MVDVFGNEIIGAYTNGVAVQAIYANGVLVWPTTPPPSGPYYIDWTPTTLDEQFIIDGVTYNMLDYSGHFTMYNSVITDSAFIHTNITSLNTNATSIGYGAFAGCQSLSMVSISQCDYIGEKAFWSCNNILDVYAPNCTYVSNYGLGRLYNVQTITLPKCSYIGSYGMYFNSSLTTMSLSKCKVIGDYAFNGCWNLESVDLSVCSVIGQKAFNQCSALSLLVLGSNSVVSIDSSYATFQNTPFANCSGTILVPESLMNEYRTAPGWSSLSCVMRPADGWHIYWTPENLSGTFKMFDNTYSLEDYSGRFYWGGGNNSAVITSYAFKSANIKTLETNVKSIYREAFYTCPQLSYVNISSCLRIYSWAFYECSSLTNVIMSNVKRIDNNAFGYCRLLNINLDLPKCSYIGSQAFYYCSSISQISLPICSYISSGAFFGCRLITDVNLPMCSYIGEDAFADCTISSISLPVCEYIGSFAFDVNPNMTVNVDLPVCSYIGYLAFMYNQTGYSSNINLILRSTSVCRLGSWSPQPPNPGYVKSIYVPSSLVSAYKTDSAWSRYSSRIFPI